VPAGKLPLINVTVALACDNGKGNGVMVTDSCRVIKLSPLFFVQKFAIVAPYAIVP
jgi:hypothetical protein